MTLQIPKIIHHIWIGGEIPRELNRRRLTWAKKNPGWELKLWTERTLSKKYAALARLCGSYPQQSDIYRTEILYNEGGVYVDIDFECLRGLEELLRNKKTFTVVEHHGPMGTQYSVGLVGAVPQHPMYAELLDLLPGALDPLKPTSLGPALLGRAMVGRTDVTVFPKRVFYPVEREIAGAFAYHHPRSGSWWEDGARFVIHETPEEMRAGTVHRVSVSMLNESPYVWCEEEKVRLGAVGDSYLWRFPRVRLPFDSPVKSGRTAKFQFEVLAPYEPGEYDFQWRMVREGVQWFGPPMPKVRVRVVP